MSLPPLRQNPPHCLEITPPSSEKLVSVMRLSDLSTEDEDSGHCKMNRYDKKIDSLMNAVGCLKSEVREVGGAGAASIPGVGGTAQVACWWPLVPAASVLRTPPGEVVGGGAGGGGNLGSLPIWHSARARP